MKRDGQRVGPRGPRAGAPAAGPGHRRRALEFLRVAHLYRLGRLPTERPHPCTRELSRWAREDLSRAVELLKSVDLEALATLEGYAAEVDGLARAVHATLASGRRVFLCGCGATGRLALSLEFLWRRKLGDDDRVVSFMAGGDVALVHALERFEDHPEYGARHLTDLGFADGDLLIATTEGGETPYVLGATEEAARISSNRPHLLYCNSNAALARNVERFRRIQRNPAVRAVSLFVGPMALTGSTRMQASTVLQLAVGLALLHSDRPAKALIARFRRLVRDTDFSCLTPYVQRESAIYESGDHVVYRVRDYGITVFTDTTERAPTFSLVPFDRTDERRTRYSLCYVVLDDADGPADAWIRLLNRLPRPLDWPDVDARTTPDYPYGFDFSFRALHRRRRCIPERQHREFHIQRRAGGFALRLDELDHVVLTQDVPELFQHLLLKLMLNIHSTLVMGRLGRYESNLMTWVTPTNGKLVDRAARYVDHLLRRAGSTGHSYEEIVLQLFAELDELPPDEPVVLATYRALLRDGRGPARADRRPRRPVRDATGGSVAH